jgi:anti-sigma B factor antagonist
LIGAGDARVIVDLSHLAFLNSVGIRALLGAAKQAAANGGRLVLCGARPMVREVLDHAGFGRVLPICDTRAEAEAAIR